MYKVTENLRENHYLHMTAGSADTCTNAATHTYSALEWMDVKKDILYEVGVSVHEFVAWRLMKCDMGNSGGWCTVGIVASFSHTSLYSC